MTAQELPLYTYQLSLDQSSKEYVAICLEIPDLSGIGETEEEALTELKVALVGWLEVIEEEGLSFPEPHFQKEEGTA